MKKRFSIFTVCIGILVLIFALFSASALAETDEQGVEAGLPVEENYTGEVLTSSPDEIADEEAIVNSEEQDCEIYEKTDSDADETETDIETSDNDSTPTETVPSQGLEEEIKPEENNAVTVSEEAVTPRSIHSITVSDGTNSVRLEGGTENSIADILKVLGYDITDAEIRVDFESVDTDVISITEAEDGYVLTDNGPFTEANRKLIVYVNGEAIELSVVDPNTIYVDSVNGDDEDSSKPYKTLSKAIFDAAAGDTIVLNTNVEHTGSKIQINKNLILDLNGHVINIKSSACLFNIVAGGEFTLTDSNTDNLYHYFTESTIMDNKVLWVWDDSKTDAKHKVSGGVITGSKYAVIELNGDNAKFIMESGNIVGNFPDFTKNPDVHEAKYDGVIRVNNGSAILKGGCICGNLNKTHNSGAVIVYNGSFKMEGGSISENQSYGQTSGVNLQGGSFTMENGEISDNKSKNQGAAVYIEAGSFIMNGGTISGNHTEISGGGIWVYGGSFTMNGGSICNNTAVSNAGGVWFEKGSMTVGGDATIKDNKRTSNNTYSNLFVDKGETISVSSGFKGDIGIDSRITPTDASPVQITNTTDEGYSQYFSADNYYTDIAYNSSKKTVMLVVRKHKHIWSYEVNGSTITASCGDTFGTCEIKDTSLTISVSDTTYNGNTHAATFTQSSFLGSTSLPAISYLTTDADGNYTVEVVGIPKNAGSYKALFSVEGNTVYSNVFTILQLKLTVNNPTITTNKTYDGSNSAAVTPGSFINKISTDTVILSAEAFYTDKNVGSGKTITVSYTIDGADKDNYIKPDDYSVLTGEITAKTVTVSNTVVENTKTYDGNTSASVTANGSLVDIVATDDISIATAIANYDNKNNGEGKTITVTYTLAGSDKDNYIVSDTTFTTGKIEKKQLSASDTAVEATRVYNGSTDSTVTNTGTLTGVVGTETVDLSATATYESKNAADNIKITVVYSITGTDSDNYIAPVNNTSLTANITQKQLTISGTTVESTKTYDGTTTAKVTTNGTLDGIVSGDKVELNTVKANYADKNVGTGKAITVVYTIKDDDAKNYFAPVNDTSLKADITKKQLTVSGTTVENTKTYDGNTTATVSGTGTINGVLDGDTVEFDAVTATYEDKNAGNSKKITVVYTIKGDSASNYIKPIDNTALTADITKKQITVSNTEVENTKTYDGNTSVSVKSNGTLVDTVASDTVSISSATAEYDNKNSGEGKTITVSYTLTGSDKDNYIVSDTTFTNGKIDKKQLTASDTAVEATRVYNGSTDSTVTNTGTLTGVVGTETVDLSATATYESKNAADNIKITVVYSITGTDSDNYIAPVNNTSLTANITKKQLTISGTTVESTKTYDGSTTAKVTANGTLDGIVSGDKVELDTVKADYKDENIGIGKAITVVYTIKGDDAKNYFAPVNDTSLKADITKKLLTVSGTTVKETKTYDGNTSAVVTENGTLEGISSTDSVYISGATANYDNKNVGTGKTITVSYTLDGEDKDNYSVSVTTFETGVITVKTITVNGTTVTSTKTYDGETTVSVTANGSLVDTVATDNVSIASVAANYDTKNVGTGKTITVSYTLTGSDKDNYTVSNTKFETGEITAKTVTVSNTVVENTKTYDGNTSASVTANGSLVDVVVSDDVSISSATASYDNKNNGEGKTITVTYTLTGDDKDNYIVSDTTFTTGKIEKKQLTASDTAVEATRVYDGSTDSTVTNAGTLSGVIGTETVNLGATATYESKDAADNIKITVVYNITGTDSGNYIAPVNNTALTANITKKQLTISGTTVESTKTYDGTTTATVTANGTLDGIESGDKVELDTLKADYADKNVGTGKAITVVYTIKGDDAKNYFAPVNDISLKADITKKQLTVSGTTVSGKTYDGTVTANATIGTVSGIEGQDDVKVTVSSANFSDIDAATGKSVTVAYGISGTEEGNYIKPENETLSADIYAKDGSSNTINGVIDVLYSGKPQTQSITVYDGITVVDAKNYDVSYKNNTDVGTATVVVTFKQNYSNSIEKNFIIEEATASLYDGTETTYYRTVAEAIDAAPEGQQCIVQVRLDTKESLVVDSGKNIVLDLNGKTITAKSSEDTAVNNNGTLTLTDTSITGGGKVTGGKVGVKQNGTMTLGGNASIVGSKQNLYLPENKTVAVQNGFNGNVYVTSEIAPVAGKPVAITGNDCSDYVQYFHSDNKDLIVFVNGTAVSLGVAVARIECGDSYATIEDAIKAADDKDVIVVIHSTKEDVKVDSGKDITIDLNGNIIEGNIDVTNGSTLTVIDNSNGDTIGGVKGNITASEDSEIQLKAGYYSEEPEERFVADGYMLIENTDAGTKDEFPFRIVKVPETSSKTKVVAMKIVDTSDVGCTAYYKLTGNTARIYVKDREGNLKDPCNVQILKPAFLLNAGADTAQIRMSEVFTLVLNLRSSMCGKKDCVITIDNLNGILTIACDGVVIFTVNLSSVPDAATMIVYDGETLKAYDAGGSVIGEYAVK